MGFQKGQTRPPGAGRKAGTPNKATVKRRAMVEKLLSEIDKMAVADLAGMTPTARLQLWESLTEYILPKMARRDPEIEERLQQLEEKLNTRNNENT